MSHPFTIPDFPPPIELATPGVKRPGAAGVSVAPPVLVLAICKHQRPASHERARLLPITGIQDCA